MLKRSSTRAVPFDDNRPSSNSRIGHRIGLSYFSAALMAMYSLQIVTAEIARSRYAQVHRARFELSAKHRISQTLCFERSTTVLKIPGSTIALCSLITCRLMPV